MGCVIKCRHGYPKSMCEVCRHKEFEGTIEEMDTLVADIRNFAKKLENREYIDDLSVDEVIRKGGFYD